MKQSKEGSSGKRTLDLADKVGRFLIHRQNFIYLFLVGIGIQYLVRSAFGSPILVGEGAAFIMVGCVGLIMSLTTVDIGKSLRDATHEEGEMTRATIREATHEEGEMTRATIREAITALGEQLGSQINALGEQLGSQINALGERMDERDRRMDERMDERDRRMDERDRRMDERLDRMSASVEAMSADVKAMSADVKAMSADVKAMSADNRAFFRQMLEAQNRILEKVS